MSTAERLEINHPQCTDIIRIALNDGKEFNVAEFDELARGIPATSRHGTSGRGIRSLKYIALGDSVYVFPGTITHLEMRVLLSETLGEEPLRSAGNLGVVFGQSGLKTFRIMDGHSTTLSGNLHPEDSNNYRDTVLKKELEPHIEVRQ